MFGNTPLMDAAVAGSVEAMTYLLDAGAEVNAQNAVRHDAVDHVGDRSLAKVRLLLDRGANPNLASKQGRTALFVAAMSEGSAPIVRMLSPRAPTSRGRDAFQNTTLTAAAFGNDIETIRLIAG